MMTSGARSARFAAAAVIAPIVALARTSIVAGEVKKIDESADKITLKHGPIKNLNMDDEGDDGVSGR